MTEIFESYWPHLLLALSVFAGATAAVHAAMTKQDVRSAIGWVGVILLSPILGATLYVIAGVNRIRTSVIADRRALLAEHQARAHFHALDAGDDLVRERFGYRFLAMKTLGDRISRHYCLTTGNAITMLESGGDAYGAMLAAIRGARRSVILETYIFDRDHIGMEFVAALADAVARGVAVRVLVDAVGARYSMPSVIGALEHAGVPADVFNGRVIFGLRLPYANLRTHRKILIVDGETAFTGGMNIRDAFMAVPGRKDVSHDTHFSVSGPVVADLFAITAADWRFTTGEVLDGEAWQVPAPPSEPGAAVIMRAVASGPDRSIAANHSMLMGALSVARRSIRIVSPYFLPDRELIAALVTAARRGVEVSIVVPDANNLTLVDKAMTAQFDQMLKHHCRIFRAPGPFDHSKLMAVDGIWAFVGSSNLDPRSLRLNFEVDLEVFDAGFAQRLERRIDATIAGAHEVTLSALRQRPFALRLIEKVFWLASPML